MVANRPAHFLRHIGLDKLRAPPTVVNPYEIECDIVQQTRQDRLLRMPLLHCAGRALQDMANRARSKPQREEIDQRWFRWHGLQRLKRMRRLPGTW
jgi:hypothetical protein